MTVLGMAVKVTMTRRGPVMPMRHVPLGMSVAHAGGHRRRGDQKRRQQPAKQILSIISTHRNTPSHSAPLAFMLGARRLSVNDTRERVVGQLELVEYPPCAMGSARAVFYGVPKEHGPSPLVSTQVR